MILSISVPGKRAKGVFVARDGLTRSNIYLPAVMVDIDNVDTPISASINYMFAAVAWINPEYC